MLLTTTQQKYRDVLLQINDQYSFLLGELQNEDRRNYIIENDLFFSNISIIRRVTRKEYIDLIDILCSNCIEYLLNELDKALLKDDYTNIIVILKVLQKDIPITYHDKILEVIKERPYIYNNQNILERIFSLNIAKEKLNSLIIYLLKNSVSLLMIKEALKHTNHSTKVVDKFIDNNPYRLVYDILCNSTDMSQKEISEEKITDFLAIIIKELVIKEKNQYHELSVIGNGGTSRAYRIGSKVLKIGTKRVTFQLPFNKRFLKPLYRAEISSLYSEDTIFCIEITNYVNAEMVSRTDEYPIYEELRDSGYYWLDPYSSNLGRLLQDNNSPYNELIDQNATSYTTDMNKEISLPAGEIVILDNDYTFTSQEIEDLTDTTIFEISDNAIEFERRYLKTHPTSESVLKKMRLL